MAVAEPERGQVQAMRCAAAVEGEGVARADVVIEAIFEDRDAKRELFERIRKDLPDHAVMATNTSAIPLGELSDAFDDPDRLIGLHFFNPVAKMPLVEVVHDTNTDSDRVDDGSSFVTQIGKYAIPVTSTPGFLVNRVLVPYMYKAMTMHRDGTPKEALDKAAVRFGMPMGPVELVDTVGLDVGLNVIDTLLGDAAGEDRKVLESMVESGKKGKKTGEGFYKWEDGKPQKDSSAHEGHDLDKLAEELIQPYLDECMACLRDDVVENEKLLDAAMIFGTGFAPFRGGPVNYVENSDATASADDSLLDAARGKSGGKKRTESGKKSESEGEGGSKKESGSSGNAAKKSAGKRKTSGKKKKTTSGARKSGAKKPAVKKKSAPAPGTAGKAADKPEGDGVKPGGEEGKND